MLRNINRAYFWDVNFDSLDEERSSRLIIERVLTLGNLDEIKAVFARYGIQTVKSTLTGLNFIDKKNLNFYRLLFNLSNSEFKCCTRRQLIH
jgi:hypothetical protein